MAIRLEVDDLAFGYKGKTVLENIGFSIGPHETLAIVGPNGAGKSTLLRCMNGLLKPLNGAVSLNGKAIETMKKRQLAGYMAYVPQAISTAFPFTVFDMVLMGRYPHGNHKVNGQDLQKALKTLTLLGIENLAMKSFAEISGGQQQKATIARALVQEAKILLLDEPTSNLDVLHQLEVMELLKNLVKKTEMSVVMSMHDLNLTARYADRVLLLNRGKLVAEGAPISVLTPDNITRVYQVEAKVKNVHGKPHITPLKPAVCSKPKR